MRDVYQIKKGENISKVPKKLPTFTLSYLNRKTPKYALLLSD